MVVVVVWEVGASVRIWVLERVLATCIDFCTCFSSLSKVSYL
jgi:hypothetical protein